MIDEDEFMQWPYRYVMQQQFAQAYQTAKKDLEQNGDEALEQFAASAAGIVDQLFKTISMMNKQSNYIDGKMAELSSLQAKLARLRENSSTNPKVRERVFAMTNGRCFYCDTSLVMSGSTSDDGAATVMHIDHIVPKSAGGPDHLTNYVPACGFCNISKNGRPYLEFIRDRHPRLKLVVSTEGA